MNFLIHHQFISIYHFDHQSSEFLLGNFLIQPPPHHSKASFRAAKSHIAFSRTACCSVPWVVKTSSFSHFFFDGFEVISRLQVITVQYINVYQIILYIIPPKRYIVFNTCSIHRWYFLHFPLAIELRSFAIQILLEVRKW